MSATDFALSAWLHPRAENLDRATLGQLVTLMNLVNAESVAAVGRKFGRAKKLSDAGVNPRQKLARLEAALKIGKLTRREGKYTRPTPAGVQVAGEVRLFLQELQAISTRTAVIPTWIIGAGDTWLQCAIIPALAQLAKSHSEWKWEVRNLRADEIRSGLRDGTLHFGFLRAAELNNERNFTAVSRVKLQSYRIVAGDAGGAPKAPKELVQWAIRERRPLAQQGSTWKPMRERLERALGLASELAAVDIDLICQTHAQAITAVESGNAWSVVPCGLARNLPPNCRNVMVKVAGDDLMLAYYDRALRKHGGAEAAKAGLARAMRAATQSF